MNLYPLIQKIYRNLYQDFLIWSILALALALTLYGLRTQINLFVTVSDISKRPHQFHHQHFRLGGRVKPKTLRAHNSGLTFEVIDFDTRHSDVSIIVSFIGALPSLFQEGKAMVADGYLEGNHFYAHTILAKHDENYQPPIAGPKI